jgi:hypothetical protein
MDGHESYGLPSIVGRRGLFLTRGDLQIGTQPRDKIRECVRPLLIESASEAHKFADVCPLTIAEILTKQGRLESGLLKCPIEERCDRDLILEFSPS